MLQTPWRALSLVILLLISLVLLATCSSQGDATGNTFHIQQVTTNAQEFAGKEITVDGAYVWRPANESTGSPATSVLATGVSTLDNGLDAQPVGDAIWIEGFPTDIQANLHQPGDAVYGFVRVTGRFTVGGGFGPNGAYQYQLQVSRAESIERIRRVEYTLDRQPLGEGKVSFFDLLRNPEQYNGQTITTQGYYFWNSVIYVLAEGVSTDEDGLSPQPLGSAIWMENFPPDQSSQLNLGPNNSFVWGHVEVTGTFQTGGGFGRDAAYQHLFIVQSAKPLPDQGP